MKLRCRAQFGQVSPALGQVSRWGLVVVLLRPLVVAAPFAAILDYNSFTHFAHLEHKHEVVELPVVDKHNVKKYKCRNSKTSP